MTKRDEGWMDGGRRRMGSLRLSREDDGLEVDGVLGDEELDAKK